MAVSISCFNHLIRLKTKTLDGISLQIKLPSPQQAPERPAKNRKPPAENRRNMSIMMILFLFSKIGAVPSLSLSPTLYRCVEALPLKIPRTRCLRQCCIVPPNDLDAIHHGAPVCNLRLIAVGSTPAPREVWRVDAPSVMPSLVFRNCCSWWEPLLRIDLCHAGS